MLYHTYIHTYISTQTQSYLALFQVGDVLPTGHVVKPAIPKSIAEGVEVWTVSDRLELALFIL